MSRDGRTDFSLIIPRPDGHCLGLFCIYNIFFTIKKNTSTKSFIIREALNP
jgi:hypothetical protein